MRYFGIFAAVLAIGPATAADFMKGRVVMEDGSAPPPRVLIQRTCPGASPVTEAITNKQGSFLWAIANNVYFGCMLQAVAPGYESNKIDTSVDRIYFSPELPMLTLRPTSSEAADGSFKLPEAASKSWNLAAKATGAKKWAEAEPLLKKTLKEVPNFAPAWNALGAACQFQGKTEEARGAYRQAIRVDPKQLLGYVNVMRLEAGAERWPETVKAAEELIGADKDHRYLEAYLDEVMARYALHDLDGAEAVLNRGLALDRLHELPRLEYFKGATLAAKEDFAGAREHLRAYLKFSPKAADAAAVRAYLEATAKGTVVGPLPLPSQAELTASAVDPTLPVVGETAVPGGIKALAAMARLKATPTYENFFLEYCKAIAVETSKANNMRTPGYSANIRAFMAAVEELEVLGERRGDKAVVTVSLAGPKEIEKARQILPLLGWKVVEADGATGLEPGDQGSDGPRQQIPAAFGIDEVAMQQTLQAGRSFTFDIPAQKASLTGGARWWGSLMKEFSTLPGGMAEAFERDPRLAKTYAALAAMPADAAKVVVAPVGMRALAAEHSDVLWLYSEKFELSNGGVAVPGGADAVWAKLVGADPHDPQAFFRALLTADRGRVAAYYSALAHADAAHQSFFTRDPARARNFYTWYRDSEELREGIGRPARVWRPGFFQKVPLDEKGNVRFPGGKAAWANSSASDEDALLHLKAPEALLAIAELEEKRGRKLDDASAQLLARHFTEWHALFPYFEVLPGLGRGEFEALEAFSKAAAGYRRPQQNLVMGEWHSVIALIVLGRKAGSIDDQTGVRAFRHACEGLLAGDYSAKALAVLREITGANKNLDDAVAEGLLKLDGAQRGAFERVRELQGAPSLQALGKSPDPNKTLAALGGLVYGAVVNPDSLLVSEDPALLSKHQYVTDLCRTCSATSAENLNLFTASKLLQSAEPPGSRITGGFMHFDGVANNLLIGGRAVNAVLSSAHRAGESIGVAASSIDATEATFRTTSSLVQVFATVTDGRGRYVDNLTGDQFTILKDGAPVRVAAFENETSEVSCTLLLDTTESMQASLPALKRAALKFIEGLRPGDSVAIYALRGGVTELQTFTTDKAAAARAVLKTEPGGMTALYDGLVRVVRDIAGRAGKKAIVVFTDGDDNLSLLPSEAAILRAKTTGVPIYTVAKGAELHEATVQQLDAISRSTGGLSFTLRSSSEIQGVFEKVFEDVMHGYLLEFQAPETEGHTWHTIEVVLKPPKGRKVRARDGYYPE